jgi:hypothetical protein
MDKEQEIREFVRALAQKLEKSGSPTKSWSLISSTLIGVTVTILAILWQFTPLSGMVVSTYLLTISLVLFVNSTTVNEKATYEHRRGSPESVVQRWVRFAEYSFGLAFTLYISTFAILGYKYLMNITSGGLEALVLPIAFMAVTWGIMGIYNIIDIEDKRRFKFFRSKKRMLWLGLEATALVFIILDYLGLIVLM